jgi:hypothetical protein
VTVTGLLESHVVPKTHKDGLEKYSITALAVLFFLTLCQCESTVLYRVFLDICVI